MCAKNYQNIAWFDELMAKIKRCSFFAPQCRQAMVSNAPDVLCDDSDASTNLLCQLVSLFFIALTLPS